MDFSLSTKNDLLAACQSRGIPHSKSQSKDALIHLLHHSPAYPPTKNVSPLRYPGGKTRACKVLHEILSHYFDLSQFDTLLSPFFGGGSFEFYLQNQHGFRIIANDKFTPLFHFWTQAKTDKRALCDSLRAIPAVSKPQFDAYRSSILALQNNVLQQSVQYFVINRCSFSGATLSGGFSEEASQKRFTPSSIQKIEQLDLTNVEFHHLDVREFLPLFGDAPNCLLFVDPPYYLEKRSKLYGTNGDLHEHFDHAGLFEILRTRTNWILTYNNSDYIRNLYRDYTILDVHWSYGMNASKASSEIVIVSTKNSVSPI